MNKLFKLSSLIVTIWSQSLSAATLSANTPEDEALAVLLKAANVDDYADYKVLSNILGLVPSNFRTRSAMQEGVENPRVVGQTQETDLQITSQTSLSRSLKSVSWYGFIPSGENFTRTTLDIKIDIQKLCITPQQFSHAFSPVKKTYTTDMGPLGFERTFSGPRSRSIGATFSDNGCASWIILHQNP
jgi:hypothetical protein